MVKMASIYAKIDRVDSLDAGFQQVPLVQNSEMFTILLWTINNSKRVKKNKKK